MKIKKRPNNYYLEVYLAVKQGIGSRLNEIGRKVAYTLGEESDVLIPSNKNESGFKLKESFKKKIESNLNNLWVDGKVFKQYFDLEGCSLSEEEITSMSGSQYKTYFYPTMAKSQITNEGLLISSGVHVIPLKDSLHFSCHEMPNDNPYPINKSRILFINDYKRGVFLDFDHLDLPITFIITNNRQKKDDFQEICIKTLSKNNLATSRIALIFLENTSYDFKELPKDQFIAITFSNTDSLQYHNFTSGSIDIHSDTWDYIPTNTQKYFKDYLLLEREIAELPKSVQVKKLEEFHYFEKVKGKSKETRELLPHESSENMSLYDPTSIRLLRYNLVFHLGKPV